MENWGQLTYTVQHAIAGKTHVMFLSCSSASCTTWYIYVRVGRLNSFFVLCKHILKNYETSNDFSFLTFETDQFLFLAMRDSLMKVIMQYYG
jgi:hypothetical protein